MDDGWMEAESDHGKNFSPMNVHECLTKLKALFVRNA